MSSFRFQNVRTASTVSEFRSRSRFQSLWPLQRCLFIVKRITGIHCALPAVHWAFEHNAAAAHYIVESKARAPTASSLLPPPFQPDGHREFQPALFSHFVNVFSPSPVPRCRRLRHFSAQAVEMASAVRFFTLAANTVVASQRLHGSHERKALLSSKKHTALPYRAVNCVRSLAAAVSTTLRHAPARLPQRSFTIISTVLSFVEQESRLLNASSALNGAYIFERSVTGANMINSAAKTSPAAFVPGAD